VPVLVPLDTGAALVRLSDKDMRKQCGIRDDNEYLFPSTQQSAEHLSGWHAIKRVCVDAKVAGNSLTATKMRHYISTLYASLELPEAQRGYFLKHIGHSAFINENVYQVPLAEAEVFQVGTILHDFDMPASDALPMPASVFRLGPTMPARDDLLMPASTSVLGLSPTMPARDALPMPASASVSRQNDSSTTPSEEADSRNNQNDEPLEIR